MLEKSLPLTKQLLSVSVLPVARFTVVNAGKAGSVNILPRKAFGDLSWTEVVAKHSYS